MDIAFGIPLALLYLELAEHSPEGQKEKYRQEALKETSKFLVSGLKGGGSKAGPYAALALTNQPRPLGVLCRLYSWRLPFWRGAAAKPMCTILNRKTFAR